MKKYTQKELKYMVKTGKASDITNYSFEEMNKFLKSHNLERIGISMGIYGMNGGLLQDIQNREQYAITCRNSSLFMAF